MKKNYLARRSFIHYRKLANLGRKKQGHNAK